MQILEGVALTSGGSAEEEKGFDAVGQHAPKQKPNGHSEREALNGLGPRHWKQHTARHAHRRTESKVMLF